MRWPYELQNRIMPTLCVRLPFALCRGSRRSSTTINIQRAFEEAAFGLEIGGVSDVVATDSGVHLIMRTA